MACKCEFCTRHREYKKIKKKIKNEEVLAFFEKIYDKLNHVEHDLEFESLFHEAYRKRHGFIGLSEAVDIINSKEEEGEKVENS